MRFVTTCEEAETLLASSETVVVFKHSTRCPVSAWAFEEVKRFEAAHPEIPVHLLKVVEDRPVSLYLADRLGVRHQSPQAILVRSGQAVWNTSHEGVTAGALEAATAAAGQPRSAHIPISG